MAYVIDTGSGTQGRRFRPGSDCPEWEERFPDWTQQKKIREKLNRGAGQLADEEWPREIRVFRSECHLDKLPDIFQTTCVLISARVKSLIERFQGAGCYQFHPVKLVQISTHLIDRDKATPEQIAQWKRENPTINLDQVLGSLSLEHVFLKNAQPVERDDYYGFNLCTFQDSIIHDLSAVIHDDPGRPNHNLWHIYHSEKRMVLDQSKLDPDIHLWRERTEIGHASFFFSNTFFEALKAERKAGLQFFRGGYKCREISPEKAATEIAARPPDLEASS